MFRLQNNINLYGLNTALHQIRKHIIIVGLGGLGVMCSPRDPRFAGSNPADVD